MEKINSEIIISSLFMIGFDKVDTLLYINVVEQIDKFKIFEFTDDKRSDIFKKYIEFNGICYKLKDNVSLNNDIELPLYKELRTNNLLIKYLNELNYEEIIIKKIMFLGIDKIKHYNMLFSNKEKEIIYKMFGMDEMIRERNINKLSDKDKKYLEKRR